MNRTLLVPCSFLALTAVAACHSGANPANDTALHAKAYLLDTLGREVGRVNLTQPLGGQVSLSIEVEHGATPGQHGIHFHTAGDCTPAGGFTAAGGHFNPGAKKHGLQSSDGPHAGDLEAITVDYMGTSKFVTLDPRVTLSPGPNSLFDADGTAIVLHALPDDQRTDPSGNSGNRIACGVITRS